MFSVIEQNVKTYWPRVEHKPDSRAKMQTHFCFLRLIPGTFCDGGRLLDEI